MASESTKTPPRGTRLSGKVAVVTGGNRGIGLAIAKALVSEASHVVISGRRQETVEEAARKLLSKAGDARILPWVCDVRDQDAVERMFTTVAEEFGHLDILVNNAGISQSAAPIEKTGVQLWRDIVDTNLTGTFYCTRSALPLMSRGATIVNVISVAARESFAGYAPYNVSKAGALSFTQTLRHELMERGIRVTALLPGAIDTDIWQQVDPTASREKMMEAESVAALVLEAVVLSPKANLSELVLDPIGGAL